jgi:hypothetical protein
VNHSCNGGVPRRFASLAVRFVVLFFACAPLFAQTSSIPERLPPGTLLSIEWHGTAALVGAQQKNHLLQLVADPSFAPLWVALAQNFQTRTQTQGNLAQSLSLSDVVSLLENPVVFGLVPDSAPAASSSASVPLVGFFAVYVSSGKADLIQKLKASARGSRKENTEVTTYDFGGTSVEIEGAPTDAKYSALVTGYYLVSNRKQVIEDLITRFRGPGKPATSLAQLPEYALTREHMAPGASLDVFAHMPDLDKWIPPDKKETPIVRFLKAIHIEKVHCIGGSISFAGEATRVQGEILGDTAPGTPFDFAGPSAAVFEAQPMVGSNPYFTISRLDLPAVYKLLRAAAGESFGSKQTASLTLYEGMAQSFLGMPISDALALFTGEFASVESYTDDGSPERMFAATIQKPREVLRILRAVLGSFTVTEDSSGDFTLLDLSYPYKDPATGTQRRKFYYVAVGPHMVVAAPRKTMLRQAMERLKAQSPESPAAGIFANPEYVQIRSLLPVKLSGLGATDVAAVPWDKVLAETQKQIEQALKSSKDSNPSDFGWLGLIHPEVIPHHLHMAVSGGWKDVSGIHFDSYLQ